MATLSGQKKGLTKTFIWSMGRCLSALPLISVFEPIEMCVVLMAHLRDALSLFWRLFIDPSHFGFDGFSRF